MFHTFGCMKHHCHLDGTPKMKIKQERGVIRVWEFDLNSMVCPQAEDDERQACAISWRVGEA